ncbi:diaminobutyrate acetyltransferase [Bacillus tianshenii]|nr:diaminobutyrate acetyltransferase [Bacillus tianshenii]
MNRKQAVLERTQQTDFTFEKPSVDDGAKMWQLVVDSGVLDENSPYSYLMMCKFYQDTCIVAKKDDEIAGFVTAFKPPEKDDAVFVWQIGVSQKFRGNGLGTKILKALLNSEACKDVSYLEATVSPSNIPSESLFRGMADKFETDCEVTGCFKEDDFPGDEHESERLFRIGPIKK